MRIALLVLVGAFALAACGGGTPAPSGPQTIRVPADHATIQKAVDAAHPGDIVLVAPGEYHESVHIKTEGITLRGENRNTVILDGGDRLQNGFWVTADDVAIENLTVRRFTNNGVLFTRAGQDLVQQVETADGGDNATRDTVDPSTDLLSGYRASYVTAYDNGIYGLYAFASTNGVFEHTYVSGHPDSGYYVGQCKPCNAVLRDVTAERNAIGYEGTNASGGVYIVESLFTHNRLGITPNSQDAERLARDRRRRQPRRRQQRSGHAGDRERLLRRRHPDRRRRAEHRRAQPRDRQPRHRHRHLHPRSVPAERQPRGGQ